MNTSAGSGTGFYGKIPSHGDFLSRHLPKSFIESLDAWIQSGLAHCKETLGESWLDKYLTSPVWHFALSAGICDQQAWVGVLMPSVDRVGRYFPLIIAAPHDGNVVPIESLHAYRAWFEQANGLALSTLDDGFAFEQFEAAVPSLALTPVERPPRSDVQHSVTAVNGLRYGLSEPDLLPDFYPRLVTDLLGELYAAHSVWWAAGSADIEGSLLVSQGLPGQRGYSAMLDGSWASAGWGDRGDAFAAPAEPPADADDQPYTA